MSGWKRIWEIYSAEQGPWVYLKTFYTCRELSSRVLIQMSLPKTEGEGTIEEIKEAMVQKHLPYIEEAGEERRADPLFAGDLQYALFLSGTEQRVV